MSVILFRDAARKYELDLGLYPDNTPVVNFEDAWNQAGGKFRAVLVRPNSLQEFFTAMFVVDSIRERGGEVEKLVLPCIPGQRQDRIKWEGDWLVTAKSVSRYINSMNFKRVVSLDPHSLAVESLIDRLRVPTLNLGYLFAEVEKYDGVIATDAGGVKRATSAAQQLDVPVFTASKHRDPATNQLSGFEVSGLSEGRRYLVVDDICDAGGTFLGLADEIDKAGATADLFVTHGLFTKNAQERLLRRYGKVFATDSIDQKRDGVTYFNVSEGLASHA
jgi:ribose-phosphate pyrophosphokinase